MTVYAAGAINSYAGSQMLMELASLDKLESLNMVISGDLRKSRQPSCHGGGGCVQETQEIEESGN